MRRPCHPMLSGKWLLGKGRMSQYSGRVPVFIYISRDQRFPNFYAQWTPLMVIYNLANLYKNYTRHEKLNLVILQVNE
jgi:hypothetical protein